MNFQLLGVLFSTILLIGSIKYGIALYLDGELERMNKRLDRVREYKRRYYRDLSPSKQRELNFREQILEEYIFELQTRQNKKTN